MTVICAVSEPRRPTLIVSPKIFSEEGSPTMQKSGMRFSFFSSFATKELRLKHLLPRLRLQADQSYLGDWVLLHVFTKCFRHCRIGAFHIGAAAALQHKPSFSSSMKVGEKGSLVHKDKSPGGTTSVCPRNRTKGFPLSVSC